MTLKGSSFSWDGVWNDWASVGTVAQGIKDVFAGIASTSPFFAVGAGRTLTEARRARRGTRERSLNRNGHDGIESCGWIQDWDDAA